MHTKTDHQEFVIFAIDDSRNDLELLRFQLENLPGLQVSYYPFTDVESALAEAERTVPDVFFLDFDLGAVSGIDIFDRIKKAELKCPAILLTGHGGEEVAVQAMRAGVSDYIAKNVVSRAGLKRAITNAVEKQRMQAEIEDKQRKLEQACKELRRQNQEIQSFYHTMSHEMKNPLTAAREFVSIVIDGLAGAVNAEQKKYLEVTRESCDILTRQMNDLLDASRLENGKLEVKLRPVQPGSILDKVFFLMTTKAKRAEITLEKEVQEGLSPVLADENRMIQVLTNLVTNALKFTKPGGKVVMKAEIAGGTDSRIRFSVADTGCGIPLEDQQRIFDRLYQVGNKDGTNHGGLGLGLFLCNQLARLHDGTLKVESTPGKGSVFSLDLGIAVAEKKALAGTGF